MTPDSIDLGAALAVTIVIIIGYGIFHTVKHLVMNWISKEERK